MTKKMTLSESLVKLYEDEMDRAELVLAAKAILDKLQNMAEDLAKVEADDVLPLLDGIRTQFGPQFADQLNNAATESLRNALEAVKTSKDQIGQSIQNMQGVVTGDGSNDMATNAGTESEGQVDMGADAGTDDQSQNAPTQGSTGGDQSDAGTDQMADEIDSLLGGEEENTDQGPEGRTKKESFLNTGAILSEQAIELLESENPDEVLAKATFKLVRESKVTITTAATQIAESYGVDLEDVTVAVRDFVEAMKLDKLLGENTKMWAKTVLSQKLAMKEGKDVGAIESYLTQERLNAANALACGKITESQCIKLAKI